MTFKIRHYFNCQADNILWGVAIIAACIILYLLFSINVQTAQIAKNTASTVHHMDTQLDSLEKRLIEDHARIADQQQNLRLCLINLFTDGQVVTKDQVSDCVKMETESAPQGSAPSNQPSSSSSSSSHNHNSNNNNSQPESSQSPTPPGEQFPPIAITPAPTNILPFVEVCVTPLRLFGGCL